MADGAASPPALAPEAHRTLVDAWLRDRRPLAEAAATIGISPADAEHALRGYAHTLSRHRQEHEHENRRLRAMLRAVARLDPLAGGGIAALVECYESDAGEVDEEGCPLVRVGVGIACATSDERWLAGAVDDALERFCNLIDPRIRDARARGEEMKRMGVTEDEPEPAESERPVYTGAPWRIEGEGRVLRLGDFDEKTGRGKIRFEVSASLETMREAPFGRMVMAVEGRAMPEPAAQKSGSGADPRQTALPWGDR